jgi:hypothetical protein
MTLKTRVIFFATVAALTTLLPQSVRAFTVLGYVWSPATMPYYINPTNLDVSPAAAEAAVRAAADAWPAQSGASFAFSFAGLTSQTTNTNDGINVVMFRNAANASALATTYSWFSGSRIVDADIVFWDGGFQFTTGTSCTGNAFFIEDVATHEFGHALGLGHSATPAATMYPSVSACSQQNRSLDADDITAVLSLYPRLNVPPAAPKNLRIIGGG